MFHPFDVEIEAFYPYTSCVQHRILEMERTREWEQLAEAYVHMARDKGITATGTNGWQVSKDNKIVFLLKTKSGKRIFIGWYDNCVSIGFACVYENHLYNGKSRHYRVGIATDGELLTTEW